MGFDIVLSDLLDAITEALTLPPAADSLSEIRRAFLEQERIQAVRDAVALARETGDTSAGLELLDQRIEQLPRTYAEVPIAL